MKLNIIVSNFISGFEENMRFLWRTSRVIHN